MTMQKKIYQREKKSERRNNFYEGIAEKKFMSVQMFYNKQYPIRFHKCEDKCINR